MKIRSLLLGSVAVAGLSTAGYAADLGVVTSLDVCDELGLSGLTISSDDNCLVITGNVSFEYDWGSYNPGIVYGVYGFNTAQNHYTILNNNGIQDSNLGDVDTWLKFVGTADSDFGPASATIKLISNNIHGTGNWDGSGSVPAHGAKGFYDHTVAIGEAWVGIGDTTMLMAGYKSSIFNKGDDVPLNYLGLFNSSAVNTGVSWRTGGPGGTAGGRTGGDVIQIVSNLGNGLSIGGGLENLGNGALHTGATTDNGGPLSAVGVLQYAGDGITAHGSLAVDTAGGWRAHAGFTGAWDPIKIVGAVAADNTGFWNALGSVSATFDMFTLAASGEATSMGEWGVGGSATATVTDGVTINLGGRFFNGVTPVAYQVWQVEAAVSAAVTDTITVSGAVGATNSTIPTSVGLVFYGTAGVAWAPGGGFTSSSSITVNSVGGYKWVFKAAKSIK
jgi:hypothetical protein